jgi:excisionase family DNA binding protein
MEKPNLENSLSEHGVDDKEKMARILSMPTCKVEEAALVLGIGRALAYNLARSGGIPSLKLGHRMVIPVGKLIAMIDGETNAA